MRVWRAQHHRRGTCWKRYPTSFPLCYSSSFSSFPFSFYFINMLFDKRINIISSVVSGMLTIGPRFGGAIDDAARCFKDAFTRKMSPEDFVEGMKVLLSPPCFLSLPFLFFLYFSCSFPSSVILFLILCV